MEKLTETLHLIERNNSNLIRENVKRVLILYEEKKLYIGDTCLVFDNLRYLKVMYPATVDLFYFNTKSRPVYDAMLLNNPNCDLIFTCDWTEIKFEEYQLVLCITYKEPELLELLHQRYGDAIREGNFHTGFYSMSEQVMAPDSNATFLFPVFREYYELRMELLYPCELYISEDERNWGDHWLEQHGLKSDESLVIMLDAASDRLKMLNLSVYFDLLEEIINIPKVRVLVFDEKGIGKKEFYEEWLGADLVDKIIFSGKQTLRQDFCIISSRYTKMMLGPCTGLMHCVSSIFNNFLRVREDVNLSNIPLIITYTGRYPEGGKTAGWWWGNAPLVHCLTLRSRPAGKEVFLLSEMTDEEWQVKDELPCNEYTVDMLMGHIRKFFRVSRQLEHSKS